jgi:geranylgeranyl diphosphate synthase type I
MAEAVAANRTPAADRSRNSPPQFAAVARELTLAPLRAAVEGLHPDLARLCGYHFGWCDPHGSPTGAEDSGKFLRATVALLSAAAVGAAPDIAVPGAVAVELVHNFSLLHDDIMDADERRRGRSAAWVTFGSSQAILGGDALTALAVSRLTPVLGEEGRAATVFLTDALNEMIRGQASDLALDSLDADEVTFEHYFDATCKTTALLGVSGAIGAVLGGASRELVAALRTAACEAGLAWQMANDVEDIWGDPAVTGKLAFSDLRQAKKTLPVIAALRSGTGAGHQLAALLRRTGATATDDELRQQAELIESAGGRQYAERLSARHLGRSLDGLARTLPRSPAREELVELFEFIVTRGE